MQEWISTADAKDLVALDNRLIELKQEVNKRLTRIEEKLGIVSTMSQTPVSKPARPESRAPYFTPNMRVMQADLTKQLDAQSDRLEAFLRGMTLVSSDKAMDQLRLYRARSERYEKALEAILNTPQILLSETFKDIARAALNEDGD